MKECKVSFPCLVPLLLDFLRTTSDVPAQCPTLLPPMPLASLMVLRRPRHVIVPTNPPLLIHPARVSLQRIRLLARTVVSGTFASIARNAVAQFCGPSALGRQLEQGQARSDSTTTMLVSQFGDVALRWQLVHAGQPRAFASGFAAQAWCIRVPEVPICRWRGGKGLYVFVAACAGHAACVTDWADEVGVEFGVRIRYIGSDWRDWGLEACT